MKGLEAVLRRAGRLADELSRAVWVVPVAGGWAIGGPEPSEGQRCWMVLFGGEVREFEA